RVDMVQVSLIVMSLLLLYRWDEKKCHSVPWLAILLMACGTLTKGPVGSIFPCMVIGAFQLMRGRSFWKTFLSLAGIGALSLVPWLVWMWAAYQQGGAEFSALMAEENTGRFFGKMSYASHENPLWYNFLTLIWGWVPWTLVLLISLFGLKWKEMRWLPEGDTFGSRLKQAWTKFRNQPPLQLFTWLAILLIFIFYCVPKSKRSVYLLPIYPFMAVLMAEYLLALVQRGAKVFRISAMIFASLGILLTVVFFTVRLGLIPESVFGTGRHAAENVAFMHALQTVSLPFSKWFLVLLPLIAAVCTWVGVAKRTGSYSLLYSIAGCILCIFVSLDAVYQPTVLAVKSDKNLVRQIREVVPQGTVYSYDDMSFYCANYYMGNQMRHFEKELPAEGFVVSSEKVNKRLLEQFGGVYEFDEVFLTERRSCDLRAKIYMYKFRKK
ncbi:MAG: dolichyl-phosphate-mannose--protein mannosyltransferase, partial [Bacteroides sp.]|nr:dolichyl-phosphate-mannose--protein mannosyltransferase [Bacteroides sp.]